MLASNKSNKTLSHTFLIIQQTGFIICLLFVSLSSFGQTDTYRAFDNIFLNADASRVNCFVQDKQGLLWFGSNKGLFSYNGYTVQHHFHPFTEINNQANQMINCGTMVDATHLYLGSDNGILIYNTETYAFEKTEIGFPTDVRSILLSGKYLWIGSLNGLYRYNLDSKQLQNFSKNRRIPHRATYSILQSRQKTLYVGTYNGLCYLKPGSTIFKMINLPVQFAKNNLLVNSLLEDSIRKCIWVGTEGYLFKLSTATGSVERIGAFDNNSIKSLALDQNQNLLLGTDNGLYVYNKESRLVKHVVHDSRDGKSLTNNIIWSIFVDRNKNGWFGTDYGVSLSKNNRNYRYVPISQLTGIGDGNQLQVIYKDSRNNFWYGGTNGLIFTPAGSKTCIWYKMGDARYPISHNRIRCIYEDKDKNLWVATDGSINRYNYQNHQFIHYNIVDSTRTRNANWAYSLFEDKQGRLWIATCLGGIFVVNKEKLIKNTTGYYVAEQNFYKNTGKKGLSDNYILQVMNDLQGNVWALTYANEINKIDAATGAVTKFSGAKENAFSLICDREGMVWLGGFGSLKRIDPKTNSVQTIRFDGIKDARIRLLTEENNHIWITTTVGTFVLDKKTLETKYAGVANQTFSCSFFNPSNNEIYLGGVDGFVAFSPTIVREKKSNPNLTLTALYVNDRFFQPGSDYAGKSLLFAKNISLRYNQNNLTFEFSDFKYAQMDDNKYVYQLEGVDNEWRTVKPNSNRISYNNLAPGNYRLTIGSFDSEGKSVVTLLDFKLTIRPPWYYSIWAKIIYAILLLGLFLWVLNYYRERHRTRIERIEKEKSLELSNLKIDFFTNVSHDFKTPLSLIIAPVSKLLVETKNAQLKKQLGLIQQNALHLNALIQQVIGFERSDDATKTNLLLSHVEFIEFAEGIFSVYEDAFKVKKLQANFNSDVESLLVNVDVLKMESVLNNLISNALKFSNEGGKIELVINHSTENLLTISISDTGIGIPKADLPFVFDRFFQSRKTSNDKEGSGIGLSLVKNYVEMHNGTVAISSEEEKGTTITLILPVVELESDTEPVQSESLNNETNSAKPLILIVEDNLQVSDFIVQALKPFYRCSIAHNGKTGLNVAQITIPDLIIADIMMPVMDGLEMCKQLRKTKELSLIPVIILTAKDDKLTEEKSIELGVNAFIPKPFDTNMLLLRIKQLIGTKVKMEESLRLEVLSTPKEIEAESWDEKLLADITKIIEDNVANPEMNVNNLSQLSGISTKQIYRRIKQLTGLTPVDYIRSIRMKKAAMLLAQRKFSVAEVMYLVGFSNHSYFSKCFQAKYGKTPKQFMEQ
jgi:signal transduction histidine kinase/ligand-binding sensor domain-containing protein/AraC-like DNA-binding protein